MLPNLLWMAAVALSLVVAGIGLRTGKGPGYAVFTLGVMTAVGLIALASVGTR